MPPRGKSAADVAEGRGKTVLAQRLRALEPTAAASEMAAGTCLKHRAPGATLAPTRTIALTLTRPSIPTPVGKCLRCPVCQKKLRKGQTKLETLRDRVLRGQEDNPLLLQFYSADAGAASAGADGIGGAADVHPVDGMSNGSNDGKAGNGGAKAHSPAQPASQTSAQRPARPISAHVRDLARPEFHRVNSCVEFRKACDAQPHG